MSEQRRRLTDDEVDVLCGGVRAVGLGLVADEWRKAMEDRKRLVKALRDRVWECECGPFDDDPVAEVDPQ